MSSFKPNELALMGRQHATAEDGGVPDIPGKVKVVLQGKKGEIHVATHLEYLSESRVKELKDKFARVYKIHKNKVEEIRKELQKIVDHLDGLGIDYTPESLVLNGTIKIIGGCKLSGYELWMHECTCKRDKYGITTTGCDGNARIMSKQQLLEYAFVDELIPPFPNPKKEPKSNWGLTVDKFSPKLKKQVEKTRFHLKWGPTMEALWDECKRVDNLTMAGFFKDDTEEEKVLPLKRPAP